MAIGSKRGCTKCPLGVQCPTKGVYISYDTTACEQENLNEKLKTLKRNLHIWRSRDLSIYGRVLIVKKLGISQFTYLVSVISIPGGGLPYKKGGDARRTS